MIDNKTVNEKMPKCYQGNLGTLLLISDLCIDYDGYKSAGKLKELIDEIKEIADEQIKRNLK